MKSLLIKDKWEVIEPIIKGKSVLDVGCCDEAGTKEDKRGRFLHHRILQEAGEVIGVDINQKQIEALRRLGYVDIIPGNVETINLNRQFEVIFAGELIEHLSNPGLFLDNMRKHLDSSGLLVITTPNRFHFYQYVKSLITGRLPNYKKDMPLHVCYYDINCLTALAERHGFKLVSSHYICEKLPTLKAKLFLYLFYKFRPNFAAYFIAVFKKDARH